MHNEGLHPIISGFAVAFRPADVDLKSQTIDPRSSQVRLARSIRLFESRATFFNSGLTSRKIPNEQFFLTCRDLTGPEFAKKRHSSVDPADVILIPTNRRIKSDRFRSAKDHYSRGGLRCKTSYGSAAGSAALLQPTANPAVQRPISSIHGFVPVEPIR